jgi:predicted  nucleic acid-binding Zn-ribbon protein
VNTTEILQALADSINLDAEEFNTLLDRVNAAEGQLLLLRNAREADQRQIKDLTEKAAAAERLVDVEAALSRAVNTMTNLKNELTNVRAAKDLVINDLRKQLTAGNPKDRDLIKRLKQEKESLQADVANQRKTLTELRKSLSDEMKARKAAEHHSAQSTMYTVKSTDSGMLMYFPKQVVGTVEGQAVEVQRSLLYIHRTSGRGGLITLDPDSQPIMGIAPKGGIRVEKELEEFAGAWLRKVKAQGNVVLPEDFAALGG